MSRPSPKLLVGVLGVVCAWGQWPEAVVGRFGKPSDEWKSGDGVLFLIYQDIGGYKGRAEFALNARSKVVIGLTVIAKSTPFAEVERRHGRNWIRSRWSMVTCGGYVEAAPVYIDPERGSEKIEWRQQGVSVERVGDEAREISYNSRPLGMDENPCVGRARKTR